MNEVKEIQELIDKITIIDYKSKKYQEMKIKELSVEIRNTMKFQQESFQRIEELEEKGIQPDLIKYAKMICKNTIEREIIKIQEAYLKKIENKYLKSYKNKL